jgi:hypothetical protein
VSSQWRFRTPTRENQAIAQNAEPRYDSEAAGDSVHLVAETQSLALVPDPPAPDPRQLTRSATAARRTDDIVLVDLERDRSSGLFGRFPWVRKQRHATQGDAGSQLSSRITPRFSWWLDRKSQLLHKSLDQPASAN